MKKRIHKLVHTHTHTNTHTLSSRNIKSENKMLALDSIITATIGASDKNGRSNSNSNSNNKDNSKGNSKNKNKNNSKNKNNKNSVDKMTWTALNLEAAAVSCNE
ncbi:hypothetical protein PoB_004271400 [Plakobranchus ocellatus]|uniref:Uncharacterized protein n=1 Tax=Plakobranchus ocellatus TaxID=259542 RepID=A0AAV4BBT6_9GAST|nr:hypothetical protein PoB_004271400 [Plakobranchus ocellatus]